MNHEMNWLKFRTLTPLWTGGVERSSGIAHETGLLGSLRHWYGGIVRAMGGQACEGAGKVSCILNPKEFVEGRAKGLEGSALLSHAGLCPVCQFFGATGWRRRFQLQVSGLEPRPLFFEASPGVYQAAGNWLWRIFGSESTRGRREKRGAEVSFTFGVETLYGKSAAFHIVPGLTNSFEVLARMAFLLDTATRYGGLGAKTQNGFGQVLIEPVLDAVMVGRGRELIRADVDKSGKTADTPDTLFSLSNFFSRTYRLVSTESYVNSLRRIGGNSGVNDDSFRACAFDIRYKSRQQNPFTKRGRDFGMRPWCRERWDKRVADALFGTTRVSSDADRRAGRIGVSHLFRYTPGGPFHLKVWGDVPPGIWQRTGNHPSLDEVVAGVDEFIRGRDGMFPGSEYLKEFEFKLKEVLGL